METSPDYYLELIERMADRMAGIEAMFASLKICDEMDMEIAFEQLRAETAAMLSTADFLGHEALRGDMIALDQIVRSLSIADLAAYDLVLHRAMSLTRVILSRLTAMTSETPKLDDARIFDRVTLKLLRAALFNATWRSEH